MSQGILPFKYEVEPVNSDMTALAQRSIVLRFSHRLWANRLNKTTFNRQFKKTARLDG